MKQKSRTARDSLLLGLRVHWTLMDNEVYGIVVESREDEMLVACEGSGRLVTVDTHAISLVPDAISSLTLARQDPHSNSNDRSLSRDDAWLISRAAPAVSAKSGLVDFSDHEERLWKQLVARAEEIISRKRTP